MEAVVEWRIPQESAAMHIDEQKQTNLQQLLLQKFYFACDPPQIVRSTAVRALFRQLSDARHGCFELGDFNLKRARLLQRFFGVVFKPFQRFEVRWGAKFLLQNNATLLGVGCHLGAAWWACPGCRCVDQRTGRSNRAKFHHGLHNQIITECSQNILK